VTPLEQAINDRNLAEVVSIYAEAAETNRSNEEAGFLLTQAYIYALEAGDDRAGKLRWKLIGMGREKP